MRTHESWLDWTSSQSHWTPYTPRSPEEWWKFLWAREENLTSIALKRHIHYVLAWLIPGFESLSAKERKMFSGTRYYLDFETINPAIPMWADTRPYQQVPFQWSCHIEKSNGAMSHEMFLDLTGDDPSRPFAESLLRTVGKVGPIVVYNQAFEKRIVRELAERFDDLAPALNKLLTRIVDLLPLPVTKQ